MLPMCWLSFYASLKGNEIWFHTSCRSQLVQEVRLLRSELMNCSSIPLCSTKEQHFNILVSCVETRNFFLIVSQTLLFSGEDYVKANIDRDVAPPLSAELDRDFSACSLYMDLLVLEIMLIREVHILCFLFLKICLSYGRLLGTLWL